MATPKTHLIRTCSDLFGRLGAAVVIGCIEVVTNSTFNPTLSTNNNNKNNGLFNMSDAMTADYRKFLIDRGNMPDSGDAQIMYIAACITMGRFVKVEAATAVREAFKGDDVVAATNVFIDKLMPWMGLESSEMRAQCVVAAKEANAK
eukprot:PhM_4_TR7438/c0_g1_i1/m.30329